MKMGVYEDEHGWVHLQDNDTEEELSKCEGFVEVEGAFWVEFQKAWVDWDSVQKRLRMLYANRQE